MDEQFEAVLEKLDKVSDEVNVNAVFGAPQTVDDRIIIPVAAVSFGIAAGVGMPGGEMEVEYACGCGTHEEGACEEVCDDPESCGCHEEESCGCGMPEGMGGGASGGNARPIAVIEITKDGATVKPIMNEQVVALAGIMLGAWAIGWVGLVLKTLFSPRK